MLLDPHHLLQIFIQTAHAAAEAAVESAAAEAPAESGSVLATLGINWKLFLAQLVNFGILLFVLWRFAFKPVAAALEARTSKIEKSLNDADRIEKDKQEFETWKNAEMAKARQESSAIVTHAQTEAIKAKDAIMQQAKNEQQKLVDQAKAQIETEKIRTLIEAKSELADLITTTTEKILRKKLDSKADQEFIKESLSQVK